MSTRNGTDDADTGQCAATPTPDTGTRRGSNRGRYMSKGNKKHGNREAKKPKQEKPKIPATANSGVTKSQPVIGGKKVR